MENTVWNEIRSVSSILESVYQELIEMSEEIEYRFPKDSSAGDDLKMLAGSLMSEIQRLYPMDY